MTLLQHTYTPRGACRDVFHRTDDEVLIAGPAGTGKSRACLEKIHHMALINRGFRGLVVRKTRTSLTSSGLVTFRRDVIPEAESAGLVRFYSGSAQEPAQYRYDNTSTVTMGGMDKASRFLSTEYDLIYIQEAAELTVDEWESLTRALRSGVVSFQQMLADCNPDAATHWLKARCDAGQTIMLRSTHKDNPLLFDEAGNETEFGATYLGRLRNLSGVRYERLYKGEWSSAEGVVYDDWSSAVHLIDRFDIPDSWPKYLAVDFGYTNPFVCQWWAADPDGRLYLYREQYATKMLVSDHADVIAKYAPSKKELKAVICDHDAEGRAQLAKLLGVRTTGARKAVREGIQAVQERLKIQGDDKPRLFILRDSTISRDQDLIDNARPTSTADEVPAYVWDQRPGKPPKEEPVKEDDHGMDAMRYMVMHFDWGRKARLGGVDLTAGLER